MTLQGMSKQENAIQVFSYGLKHQFNQLRPYIIKDETPVYQSVLAFIYLGVSLAAAVISTWLKGKKAVLLLLVCGLAYIAYALGATYVITQRLSDSGIALQGWTKITLDARSISFEASLMPGYYLAYITGILLVILALLRNIIVKPVDVKSYNEEQRTLK